MAAGPPSAGQSGEEVLIHPKGTGFDLHASSQCVPSFGITIFAHQGPAPVGEPWGSSSTRSSSICPPGCWDFVPGLCVATAAASSPSSVLAALHDGLLTALPSRRAAARRGLVFTCTGRGEWMVCVCGVLHRIHSPFPTRVIEESPILQAGLAPADPSSTAAAPVSGSAAACVLQAQLCRRRLSRFLVTSCY